ncbi:MAG: dephospho-CoA kinase [Myxococcota bacterium]
MNLVGLTGGIGTGKSTVARILDELGASVIDADQVAREVVAPGSEGLRQIVEAFGQEVLTANGTLNRAAMRQRIVRDSNAKATLEAITHPLIATHILKWIEAEREKGTPVAVVEAALMVETGSYRRYPHVWVVSANEETQVARVMSRDGVSESDARAIVNSQWPMAKKEAVATCIIRNDGDLNSLRKAVETCFENL